MVGLVQYSFESLKMEYDRKLTHEKIKISRHLTGKEEFMDAYRKVFERNPAPHNQPKNQEEAKI